MTKLDKTAVVGPKIAFGHYVFIIELILYSNN